MAEMLDILSIDCVAPVRASLGEGPLWDPRIGKLVFLDIKGETIHLFDPQAEQLESHDAPGMVSALAPRGERGYVCAMRSGFARLDIIGGRVAIDPIIDPEADHPSNRFNDGKADPAGGFWAGTMDDAEMDAEAGSWWRLAPNGSAARLASGFHVANGPAFDQAGGRVFLTDSARQTIFVGRSDGEGLGDMRVFLQFAEGEGYPDGMEIDSEKCLWVAFWDGGAIRRFSPDGDHLQSIALPVPRPTSLTFIDNQIFVTSARIGLQEAALRKAPDAGGLFRIRVSRALSGATLPRCYCPV